jgi:DNA modification methylase
VVEAYYRSPSGDVTLYQGDAAAVLRALPAGSVHTCITSPPYWSLRDYNAPGQLGLEDTVEEYVEALVGVFGEVRRVLRDDATLWLNLGDCFANERSWGGKSGVKNATSDAGGYPRHKVSPGLGNKQLVGVPWRVAFALQADGWLLRSDLIWFKPNPMPESVRDRPTRAHEYVFLFSKGPRYFYDADAIREPHAEPWRGKGERESGDPHSHRVDGAARGLGRQPVFVPAVREYNPAGRNRRSVWEIATEPYPNLHFATFPQKLVEPCLLSGSSARGCCPACGAPWVRTTERESILERPRSRPGRGEQPSLRASLGQPQQGGRRVAVQTTGWRAGCACDAGDPTPCTVLDPFAGASTTGVVARKHGRSFIGIELSEAYCRMSRERLCQMALPIGGLG